jgi:hypothetical protein
MNHDSDIIIERVRATLPRVLIRQLAVAHPGADDDGIWFFTMEGSVGEVQMESSTYDLPFLVEHDQMTSRDDAILATSVEQVVGTVCTYLAGLNSENPANKGRQATASPSPAT